MLIVNIISPFFTTMNATNAEIYPHIFLATGISHETKIKAARIDFLSEHSAVEFNVIPYQSSPNHRQSVKGND
jgi:hypothetical protein